MREITNEIFNAIKSAVSLLVEVYNPDINDKNVENSFASSHANELWNAQILTKFIDRQDNPLTADSITEKEYGTLEEWGFAKLGRKLFVSGRGEYLIKFVGTGGTYLAGISFTNTNTGFTYTLKDTVVVNPSSTVKAVRYGNQTTYGGLGVRYTQSVSISETTGTVIADLAGIPAALRVGDKLSTSQVQAGIDNPSIVLSVIVEPTDSESISDYRSDALQGYRIPARGGARGDYAALWAQTVSGVRRALYYAGSESGVLGSAWMLIEGTNDSGLASVELIDAVKRKIDAEIPGSDCGILFESVSATGLNTVVLGLAGISDSDESSAIKSINSTVDLYYKNIRPFLDGVDRSTDRNDTAKRAELTAVIMDAVQVYGGVISDAYWNSNERERTVLPNEIFRSKGVSII